jgi:hypothetical protein
MDESAPARVVFHSTLVLLIGLLCGIPYGRARSAGGDEALARAWQVAHLGITAGGIWGTAVGPALRHTTLGVRGMSWLVGSLLTSLYGFALALLVGPLAGVRGLTPQGPPANWLAFAGNTVASVASLIAASLLAIGAWRRMRASPSR